MFAFRSASHASRAILLGAFIVVSATGCQLSAGAAGPASQPAPGAATVAAATSIPSSDAPATLSDPAVQALLGDLRAARTRHDARAFQQFRHQLTERLGAAALDAADATYHRVLGALVTATALHDPRAQARYRQQLRALCDPATLTSALEPCETDLPARAG